MDYCKTIKQAKVQKARYEFLSDKKFLIFKSEYGYTVDYEYRKDIHLECGEEVVE